MSEAQSVSDDNDAGGAERAEVGGTGITSSLSPEDRMNALEERFNALDIKMKRAWTRTLSYRNKIFALQHAFIMQSGLRVCELGHPSAEIFPVEIRANPNAPVRVLAFGSQGMGSGLPPKQFFNSFKDKDCEILFFKDFRQCWYQAGLLGLSHDVPSTIDYLRDLLGSDSRPLATVGASSGGFAAVLFGAALGARKIVAFSPQTQITAQVFNRFKTEDSDLTEMSLGTVWTDLASVLAQHPLVGKAQIIYARRAPYDAQQAKLLEGIPGVELRHLEWNGHNTATFLRSQGQLDAVIDDLVAP